MQSRSAKSWTLIGIGVVLIASLFFGVLVLVFPDSDLARVKLPGTNLTLVLREDENDLHRYDVLASGKKVVSDVLLGSRGGLAATPQVSVLGDHIIVTFRTTENTAPHVEFDLTACRIVSHSDATQPLPALSNCQRH
jgi:hypothetical protein